MNHNYDKKDLIQYFKNYTRMYRKKYSKNEKKYLLKYDVHSLNEHRINNTLNNINVFKYIYNIKRYNNYDINIRI
jgi:predicted metalloendopeptidase